MKCCVTGHRPPGFPFPRSESHETYIAYLNVLHQTLESFIQNGYSEFVSGMADGADLDFASQVLLLKKNYPFITLEAALPYPLSLTNPCSGTSKKRRDMIKACDVVQEISPYYHRGCMQKRNEYMVNQSNLILAIWNQTEKGGTWNTIRYARERQKNIHYLLLADLS